jgi:hypothetical protein
MPIRLATAPFLPAQLLISYGFPTTPVIFAMVAAYTDTGQSDINLRTCGGKNGGAGCGEG